METHPSLSAPALALLAAFLAAGCDSDSEVTPTSTGGAGGEPPTGGSGGSTTTSGGGGAGGGISTGGSGGSGGSGGAGGDGGSVPSGQVVQLEILSGPSQVLGHSVEAMPNGDAVLLGRFTNQFVLDGQTLSSVGLTDLFLTRLDRNGSYAWTKALGTPQWDDDLGALAVGPSGDVLIAGSVYDDIDFGGGVMTIQGTQIVAARYDANGQHLWSTSWGGPYAESIHDAAIDASGNMLLVGNAYGQVDFGGGPIGSSNNFDLFVVKLAANGAHLWSKSYGTPATETTISVGVDPTGAVSLCGRLEGPTDFGGGPLSPGADALFAAKLDGAGNHLWSRTFGGTSALCFDVVGGPAGEVVVAGRSNEGAAYVVDGQSWSNAGGFDVFVTKLDGAAGAHAWSAVWGGPDIDGLTFDHSQLAVDGGGNVVVGGVTYGGIDFGDGPLAVVGQADGFVVRLSSSGQQLWSHVLGASDYDHVYGVATTLANEVLAVGRFEGSWSFGGQATATDIDGFLLRLSP